MDSDRVFEGKKKRPKGLFYVITFSIINYGQQKKLF